MIDSFSISACTRQTSEGGAGAAAAELIELSRELARYNRPYTTYLRDEGDRVVEAVEEALQIAGQAGVATSSSQSDWNETGRV